MDAAASNSVVGDANGSPQSTQPAPRIDWSTVHLWGAMLGIGLQPISTATGNIGFGIAIAATVPRAMALLPAWRTLLRQGWMLCLLAWLVWSWASLLWSTDIGFGIEQLRSTRVLLWIPVLWDLRDRLALLVFAVISGTTVMCVIQSLQMAIGWPIGSKFPAGWGFTTGTQTALWAAVSIMLLACPLLLASKRQFWSRVPILALHCLGVALANMRAPVLGLAIAGSTIATLLVSMGRTSITRAGLASALVATALLAAVIVAQPRLVTRFGTAVREMTAATHSNGIEVPEYRLAMWKMALEGWRKDPVCGCGIGGIPAIAAATQVKHPTYDMHAVRMVHNTYVHVLTETGLVGIACFATFIVLLLRDSVRSARRQSSLVGALGALVLWFVAAVFDGYQQSGGFLSVGAILIPLALAMDRYTSRPT